MAPKLAVLLALVLLAVLCFALLVRLPPARLPLRSAVQSQSIHKCFGAKNRHERGSPQHVSPADAASTKQCWLQKSVKLTQKNSDF